ncbi:hypothetical protein E4U43_001975 [Claviceps pusilla]|uniref:Uncharacterized protein n=1 Tax=Claviceps pusilla TaxID=123648 RepID=A0A9P7N6W8_9HYPO|nr:hypothetical protein E4U43_001975 [Claviceps pusilla]
MLLPASDLFPHDRGPRMMSMNNLIPHNYNSGSMVSFLFLRSLDLTISSARSHAPGDGLEPEDEQEKEDDDDDDHDDAYSSGESSKACCGSCTSA